MTVLTSESQVLNGTRNLPRVNLLPPEIAERRAFKRVQIGLGAAVLASVGVVGLLYLSASQSVSAAQSDLDAATSKQTQLTQQVAQYNGVSAIYAAADAAQAQLSSAMGDEVRYSQVLNDLSLGIPGNVWLKNLTVSQTPPAAAAPTTATAPQPAGASVATGIGQISFTGVAFSHDDVATWLEAVAGLRGYTNSYFSNSTEALIGTRPTVNFTSTTTLTSAAESGRYNKPAGG